MGDCDLFDDKVHKQEGHAPYCVGELDLWVSVQIEGELAQAVHERVAKLGISAENVVRGAVIDTGQRDRL